MLGWKGKFVFLLIVYFAGFATAIYCLAPAPDNQAAVIGEKGFTASAFQSDEFAKSFNTKLHKFVVVGKDAAMRAGEFLKQKINEQKMADNKV